MKNPWFLAALWAALLLSSCQEKEGWTLVNERTGARYPATVPSTVAGVLADNGVLPANLLEEMNYAALDASLLEGPWTYRQVFRVAQPDRYHTLRFDGIGYRADILLNGVLLASRDTTLGVFAVREFDVTGLLKKKNSLEVRLEGARPGDLNIGFVDWNPVPAGASEGLVREVTLIESGAVRLKDSYVHSLLSEDLSEADLLIRTTVANLSEAPQTVVLDGTVENLSYRRELTLPGGAVQEVFDTLHVDAPRIWWSRDLGTPELYTLQLEARIGTELSCRDEVCFGIRRIESRIDENGHRAFWLNGKKLLLLGGGWTDEIFLRDTHESIRRQLELVCEANLNFVRFENVWGKDSYVYDLCDRMGLLALVGWSCQWEWEVYCGVPHDDRYGCILSPEQCALAVRYFADQLRWMRNHPSVIGWLTGSDRIPQPELEKAYLALYEALDHRPYICSAAGKTSLAGPSGTKMEGPYEYVGPEYWYDAQNRLGSASGFNTETSVGMNIPQLESLRRMLGEDCWPLGPVWDFHCTSAGEDMHDTHVIREVVEGQYGMPATLEGFVARAHAVDYDGTRAMFEAFRVRRAQSTGLVQWMQNSAWPSLYWQLYDYYGIPTAGYYGVKKGCAPLQILYNWAERRFYAVNGTAADAVIEAGVRIFDAASAPVKEETLRVFVPEAGAVPLDITLPAQDVFVFIDGPAENFYAIPAEGNIHDWEASSWYQTPIGRYAQLGFVTALGETELSYSIADGCLTVENPSSSVVFQVVLKAFAPDGSLDPDVRWSDNFFALPPHGRKSVRFTGQPRRILLTNGLGA